MSYQTILRSNVRAELARRDLQVQEAAELIGMNRAMLSSRLHGRTEWRMNELVTLARVLGVPFARLTAGIDEDVEVVATNG